MHKTLFISDLHLDETEPTITKAFLTFLKSLDAEVDAIYILGDLFETWIGDDEHTHFHQSIINALRDTHNRNIKLYFLPGNRDFLIGDSFLKQTGCEPLKDPTVIYLYDTKLLLMHGDTLCIDDRAYQRMRRMIRMPWVKNLYLSLPLPIRRHLANFLRKKSKAYTTTTLPELMDVNINAVKNIMQTHSAQVLIHGHTHLPGTHYYELDHGTSSRMVLGAWHEQPYVLCFNEKGNFEVIK